MKRKLRNCVWVTICALRVQCVVELHRSTSVKHEAESSWSCLFKQSLRLVNHGPIGFQYRGLAKLNVINFEDVWLIEFF